MDPITHAIALAGLAMFVFGLAIGFALKAFPNPRAALSSHLNAVQSGTFLIALALLWPKLSVWTGAAAALGHATCIAFWVLEIGMTIAAFAPAEAPVGAVKRAAGAFQGLGAIVMFVTLAALLFTFGPAARVG